MCGRYSLTKETEHVARLFELEGMSKIEARYNIAPTQRVGAVIRNGHTHRNEWRHLHWGLIPHWSKDPAIGNRLINARSETVSQKPAFRAAIKTRRCLIPAEGFYEWKKTGRTKQPHYICRPDGELFAFAGLWEHWQGDGGEEVESCAILTTEPNELMRPIHNRMPVILESDAYGPWLDTKQRDPSAIAPLLRPLPADRMVAWPVSTYVNSPRNEGSRCVQRELPEGLFE